MITFTVDAKAVLNKLNNIERLTPRAMRDSIRGAASFGVLEAQRRVPKDSLATMHQIVELDFDNESWVVSRPDPSDLRNKVTADGRVWDKGKALNVLLETGDIAQLNWHGRTGPKTGEFHFMENSVEPISRELQSLLIKRIDEITR